MKKWSIAFVVVFVCWLAGNLYSSTPLAGQFSAYDSRDAIPPSDLSITVSEAQITLSWTAVAGATSYKVEASDIINDGFDDASTAGTFNTQGTTVTWICNAGATHRFYRVRSIIIPIPANFIAVGGGMFHNGVSEVYISSFYMDKYELTQGAYLEVMGSDPAWEWGDGPDRPVYNVNWFNAIAYCNKRSINEGLTPCYTFTGCGTNVDTWPANWYNNYPYDSLISCSWTANGYRLPTEAEWEFAARGGSLSQGYTYSGSNTLAAVGWTYPYYPPVCHVVGGLAPNELGLYDMSGNAAERCWDIWAEYPEGEQVNPHGPGGSGWHIYRGGTSDEQCAVNVRVGSLPDNLGWLIGFRICRIMP